MAQEEVARRATRRKSAWERYGVAVGAVLLATLLTDALRRLMGLELPRIPFAFYFPAVVLSALYSGRRPALVAVALSALLSAYLFLAPVFSLAIGVEGLLQIGVFVGVAFLIIYLTERSRHAEVSAYENEERLSATLRSIGDGVIATDRAGRVVFMNPVAERLTGWSAREAAGRPLAEVFRIVSEETGAEAESPVVKVLREGAVVGLANHTLLVARDGKRTPIDDSGAPIRDALGRINGVVLVFHDISERREAEEASWRLAAIVESSDDAIIAKTLDGIITSWNAGAERMYGYTASEAVGRHITLIVPPERHSEVQEFLDAIKRRERVEHRNTVRVRKDGSLVNISLTISPVKAPSGEIIGASTIARDITRSRQAEEALRDREARLRRLVESNIIGVMFSDERGQVTDANDNLLAMIGYTREELRAGHVRWSDMTPPEYAQADQQGMAEALARGACTPYEKEYVRKDGSRVPVLIGYALLEGSQTEYICFIIDLTEQKRTERERIALARQVESERGRLKNLLANVPGVVWEAWGEPDESEQRIDFVSDHVETMLGYTVEEWLGAPNFWLTIVHEEDRERAAREAREIFDGRRGGTSQFRWICKDGRAVPVEAQSNVICDAEGRPVGMRGVTLDISERKRAEEALRQSEQQYRYLADAMPQIVWTARPDGYLDYYNQRWFDYTGMTLEQTQGWGWQPALHPEDLEQALRRWSTSVQTGNVYEIEYRLRRASDGSYRWHLARAVPLRNSEGRIVKWFGTATDIDDQKRAAETSRFMAEAGDTLVSSLDYQTTLATLSHLVVPRFADWCLIDIVEEDRTIHRTLAHTDPRKEALGRELTSRYPPDTSIAEGPAKVFRTGQPVVYTEIPEGLLAAVARDAEHLRVLRELGLKSYICVPLLARGRTIGTITLALAESGRRYAAGDLRFVEDLAHRAALAVDNARLYRRMEQANRSKDEFLATLSHELRTPLTPIIGWVHMLRGERLPESETPHGLAVIDKNSQALARLINDLLDMSAIMSGKMRIERAPVELEGVLEEAVEAARTEGDKRGVRLDIELEADSPQARPVVSGDRVRLVQVFSNLLNNAVKFSGNGSRVRISCRSQNGEVRVSVEDEGQGITPEFLPHVFERFRQADGTTTRAYGGLGIGLALVKSFVEAHGGQVVAESEGVGHGSRFNVTLPLIRQTALDLAPAANPTSGQWPPENKPGWRRVLVVEDARDTLELLQTLFEGRGFETTLCETASEALRVASSARFDIIVSDIGLPHIDGYDLIRQLRQMSHLRGVPAVALTGYAAPKDIEAALLAGYDLHIPKPVDPTELVDAIERLIKEKSGV